MAIPPISKYVYQIPRVALLPSPPSKKQRINQDHVLSPAHPVSPALPPLEVPTVRSPEERARKIFLMHLCFQWLAPPRPQNLSRETLFIISSYKQLRVQKEQIKAQAKLCFERSVICWVDVPKEAFFERQNFEYMVNAISTIPLGSAILIQEGNTLLIPQCPQKPYCRPSSSKLTLTDKVIVFDPEGSIHTQMVLKFLNATAPETPHHYLTTGSSLDPLKKLTERSVVYFSEKGKLILQTPKALTAKGFRVTGSLGKKPQ